MGKLFDGYEKHRIKAVKTVLGEDLPDWIPDGDEKLINHAISDFIKQGFQAAEVAGWVCDDADVPLERLSPVLTEHLFYLLKVKRALIQGERGGIPLLLGGKQTHRIIKLTRKAVAAKAGRKKHGSMGPAKVTLERIVSVIGSATLDDVLSAIEDGDERVEEEVYYKKGDPSPATFCEVDRIRKTIKYEIRENGQEKTIKFGTLNNYLTVFR